jgi:cytochrome P450
MLIATALIEAGAESTSSAINSCLLYLAAHPDIQRRAHHEIDEVVGRARSPTFADANHLPYIRAICKEILRIRPLAGMTIPHYTTADVSYKGRKIPKNSIVAMSQYAIHYDPSLFPEPESFKPERYLNHPHGSAIYAAAPDPYDRDHWDFGAGRRICPGMHLAENSMFITIAKTLWAFDLVPPGKVDLSHDAYEPGTMTIPKPFSLSFIPRNIENETVLRREWELKMSYDSTTSIQDAFTASPSTRKF